MKVGNVYVILGTIWIQEYARHVELGVINVSIHLVAWFVMRCSCGMGSIVYVRQGSYLMEWSVFVVLDTMHREVIARHVMGYVLNVVDQVICSALVVPARLF